MFKTGSGIWNSSKELRFKIEWKLNLELILVWDPGWTSNFIILFEWTSNCFVLVFSVIVKLIAMFVEKWPLPLLIICLCSNNAQDQKSEFIKTAQDSSLF